MERMQGLDEARIAEIAQQQLDGALAGEDNDLDPGARRDREEVVAGSNLKRGDDIMIIDVFPLRVIGPARGATSITGFYPDWFGNEPMYLALEPPVYVTDRAPLDPNETPMPVFPEETP
jgi:hypothetical protein